MGTEDGEGTVGMLLTQRRIAMGVAVAVGAAAQFVIFAPQSASAADVSTWAALQSAFSGATSGATITLTGDITGTPGQNLGLPAGGDVTLDLNGHTLDIDASTGGGAAGIRVTTGMSLTITDTSASGAGHLIARGGLVTLSNGGAGIGGNAAEPGGTITIKAGTVDATGGYQAAGIGGANSSGGTVTISGGTVHAVGGFTAAGIGGGWSGNGGTITISGGTVQAVGGTNSAGIGAGVNGAGGAVSISGGAVTALSGGVAAAVGGSNGNGPGTLDVFAMPFGDTGTGGGLPQSAPAITPHATGGLRYAVDTTGRQFQLRFGQVLSFDSSGGSSVADQFVAQGTTPTAPAAPTFADHVFLGWYTSATGTTRFDFSAPLTADTTAFAQWANSQNAVSFDLNGHGAAIADQVVAYGDKATAPDEPSATGYTFGGWYTDAALTKPYDFSAPVTAPITLHAKWTVKQYTVTFDPADGGAVKLVTVDYGTAVGAPTAPTRAGYTFTGWYSDKATTTKYDFKDPVVTDLHLYAGWEAVASPPPTAPTQPAGGGTGVASTGVDVPALIGIALLFVLCGVTALVLANRRKAGHI